MLVAAAVCPHPPLLVPEIGVGAAPELDDLRAACDAVVAALTATDPEVIVVVGAGAGVEGQAGSLAAYGVPVRVGVGPPTLPLAPTMVGSMTRAAWQCSSWAMRAHGVQRKRPATSTNGRLALTRLLPQL